MPVIEGYRFAVDLEDRGLTRSLREIKKEATALKNVMRANFAEIKNGESTLGAYKQRVSDASKSIDTYKIAIDKLQRSISAYESEMARTNVDSDKYNRKIVTAKGTIERYRIAIANLERQMKQDNEAIARLSTGLDGLRKTSQGVATANKALVESLKQGGHYYASNRANAKGLKTESEALRNQFKAEAEVTRQLTQKQKDLHHQIAELPTVTAKAKASISSLKNDVELNRVAYEKQTLVVKKLAKELGEQDQQTVAAIKKQVNLREAYDKSTKALEKAEHVAKSMPETYNQLNKELGENTLKLGNQAKKTQEVSSNLQKTEKQAKNLRNTRLGSFYSAASQRVGKFSQALKESTSNTRKWWQESKSAFAGVTLAMGGLAAGAGKAVHDAAAVQKQYIEVKNLIRTSGESATASIREMNKMQSDGVKYSEQYGFAQKEIGHQYEELVRRGYSGTAAIGSMNSMMKAARASGDDLADVVKVTSSAVDAFGLRVDDNANKMERNTERVANALASGADRTASGFHDMGIAMGYSASTAKTVGWSVEQTSAALGELSNRGIESSSAGTGLRKVMLSLISPTKNADEALASASLSIDDFKTKSGKLKDVDQVFQLINQHTHDMSKTEQGVFFKKLFGTTGVAAGEALAQSAGGVKNVKNELGDLIQNIKKDEKSDYIGRLANKNMKSAQMQIERLKRTAEAWELAIGAKLLPAVNKVGNEVAKWAVSKEGQRSMDAFAKAAGDVASRIAAHTKDVIAFSKGFVDGMKGAYHFTKPLIVGLGKIVGFFNKSSKGSQSTARNLGKLVGYFATAAVGIKVVKTLFGGVFAIAKDTTKTTWKFVNWIKGGTKAQRILNLEIKEANRLLKESVALQSKINKQKGSKGGSGSSALDDALDIADDLSSKKKGAIAAARGAEDAKKYKLAFNKGIINNKGKIKWRALFKYGSEVADESGGVAGLGWARTLAAKLGDAHVAGKAKWANFFKVGSVAAEEAGKKGGTGFIGKALSAIKIGGKALGIVGTAAFAGIDIIKGIRSHNPDQKMRSYGSGIGTIVGGGIAAAFGPEAIPIGAAIGGSIGHFVPEAIKIGKKIGNGIAKGIGNMDTWLNQAMAGDTRGMGKGWNNFLGGMGNWFDQTFGVDTGKHSNKSTKRKRTTISQKVINTGVRVKKQDVANLKAMTQALKGYASSLSTVKSEIKKSDPSGELNRINKFLVDHTKSWKTVSKPIKDIGDAFKYLSKFAASVAKKDAFAAFNNDLPKLDSTLKNHGKSIKKGIDDLTKALKGGGGKHSKSLLERFTDLSSKLKTLSGRFKDLNSHLNKTASDFKTIGKVTKEFTGKKNPFKQMADGLDKLKKTLKSDTKDITTYINKLRDAFKGKKKEKSLASLVKNLSKPLKDMTSSFKSLKGSVPKVASGIKSMDKNIKDLSKGGKKSPINKISDDFDHLKKRLDSDTKSITKNIDKIASSLGGKKGFNSYISTAESKTKSLASSFKSLTSDSKSLASNLDKASSAISKLSSSKSGIDKVSSSIKSLSSTIKNYPFGNSFASQAKKASDSLSGKGNFAAKFSSYSSSIKGSASKIISASKSMSNGVTDTFKTLKSSVSSTFKSMWDTVKENTIEGLNDIIDVVNDGVDNINDAVESMDDADKKHPAKHASHVHLAEGTDWQKRITKPTLAVLNDGTNSPENDNREGLLHPNGTLEYLKGRNIIRMLLPGDEVIKASDMAKLPHYAKGTTNSVWNLAERADRNQHLSKELVEITKKSFELQKREAERKKNKSKKSKSSKSSPHYLNIDPKNFDASGKTVYLDSGYFSKSGKKTGKVVAVSKEWLKKYEKSQTQLLKNIGKKITKRRSTRRRRKSSSSRRRSSSGKNYTWRISKYGNRYRDYYQPVSTRSRRSSSSSESSSSSKKVSVSVSGEKELQSAAASAERLASALKELKSKNSIKISVSYSGTYRAKQSIGRLISAINKLNKKKIKKIKVNYSGTYKAKKSIDRLTKSIKALGSKKVLSKISSLSRRLKTTGSRLSSVASRGRKAKSALNSVASSASKATSKNKTLAKELSSLGSHIKSLYKTLQKHKFGKYIKDQAEEAVKSLKGKGNFAKEFKKLTEDFIKSLKKMSAESKKEFKDLWNKLESETKQGTKRIDSEVSSFGTKFKHGFASIQTGVKTSFSHFWNDMKNAAGQGLNKVIGVINNGIGNIDDVIDEFGGSKTAVHKVDKVKYATGTGVFSNQRRAITKPTLAILNDGNDSPETGNKETIWNKRTGEFGVVQGRNVPFLLTPDHEVLNATESRALGFTHFATGTGALKKLYEQAKKYWKNPSKTGKANFSNIKGLSGAINRLAQGLNKKAQNEGVSWWSQLWKMVENKVNDDDLGPASGLLKAVEQLGKGTSYSQERRLGPDSYDCSGLVSMAMEKYYHKDWGPLNVAGLWQHAHKISKSEAKPGDPIFWLPNHHVGVYAGGDKYWSAFSSDAKPQVGMHSISGSVPGVAPTFGRFNGTNTNGSTSDKKINVKANSALQKKIKAQVGTGFWKTIQKIADEFGDQNLPNVGGNAKAWTSYVKKAAEKMHANLTGSDLSKILSMIQAESGGNAKITQGIWDINMANGTPAQGLLQYIPSTFKAFAMPGHTNIKNGYDQLLALFNDSNWKNDIHYGGGWGPAPGAHRRFANGGIADRASIFGEAGPEMAIPLGSAKNSRAWELVGKTIAILSKDSNSKLQALQNTQEQKEEHDFRQAVLLILRQLLSKNETIDVKFDMNGRNVFEGIKKYIKEDERKTTLQQRRGLSGHF